MHKVDKTVGVNLLIFLIYTLSSHIFFTQLNRLILLAVMIVIQVVLNLIYCIVNFSKGDTELGKAFLLSAGLVLVIGFSICSGSLSFD
jgi:hypothetical protein